MNMLKPHKLYPTQQACCSRPRQNCAVRNTLQIGWRRFGHLCPAPVSKALSTTLPCQEQNHSRRCISEKINSEVSRRGVCKHHVQIVSANRSRKRHRYRNKRSRRPCSPPHHINPNAFTYQLVAKPGCTENSNTDVMMVARAVAKSISDAI
jgi:hypothetical protein